MFAVDSMKEGAHDYLLKPTDISTLSEKIMECHAKTMAKKEKT
jgi:FixJ family two-component response regulator